MARDGKYNRRQALASGTDSLESNRDHHKDSLHRPADRKDHPHNDNHH